jgi:endonuclease YncB( thermonuclease family)
MAHTLPEKLSPAAMAVLAAARRGADTSFAGRVVLARVVDVHDGDTVRIAFVADATAPAPCLVQVVARLAGYDSPEIRPALATVNRAAVVAAGQAARAAIAAASGFDLESGLPIPGRYVVAALSGFDKYGRVLTDLYTPGSETGAGQQLHINRMMIDRGFGVAYGGGSKSAAWLGK